jgi:hypothetical protein
VVSFTLHPLYPRYPLYRRLGGPQSRSGRHGEEKILDPTGTRTPTPQSFSPQPVTIRAPHEISTKYKAGEMNVRRIRVLSIMRQDCNTYRAVILPNIAEISGCGGRHPQMLAIGSCLAPVWSRTEDPLLRDVSTHCFPAEQKLMLYLL